ncbi:MAG: isochorismatase family protein [Paracoccaceae bacterium]
MSHTAVDRRFHDLVYEHEPVHRLGHGFTFTEGPIWHPVERHLLFSDMPADVRRRWTPGREGLASSGRVEEVLRPSNKGNGMTYDADLNLLVCEHSTSAVARFRPDGTREVLCTHFEGRELNSPNDLCVRSDGAVFFTDPTFGRMEHFGVPRPLEMGFQGVYMLPPGHRPGEEPRLVSDRYMFAQPNGLCFSPCERFLWVNDTEQANIRMFDVGPDGMLRGARVFASGIADRRKPGRPDGMKADTRGNVWVTAPGGVWVYGFDGLLLGRIAVPEMVANLHWGADDWQTLFMCATTGLSAMRTTTRGRAEPFMTARPARHPPASPDTARAAAAPGAPGLDLDPGRCALILQDLQNDVISEGGAFAASGAPAHARAQGTVANAARLADACRRAGVLVIHVWFVCEPGHPALQRSAPLFEGLKAANALVRGTWGVAPVEGLAPEPGDLVVEKMSMSAWETGRLEAYLKGAGRDVLINCGAWTNMSVEHTARTGADKGYRVVVPEDACSTMNADWHRASIDFAMGNVATVTDTDTVLATLLAPERSSLRLA